MAFRDKEAADQLRIDALQDELDEKDAEIARLKRQLAGKDETKKAKKKRAPVPTAEDLPEGDVWDLETTHPPGAWKWGIGWFAVLGAVVAYLAYQQGPSLQLLIPVAAFGIPGLVFLRRSGLTLDRKRGEIIRWDWLLFRIRRRHRVEGKDLELLDRTMSPKNGPNWTAGVLRIDDHELFLMKKHRAERLARRIAAFMSVGLTSRRETSSEVMRRAEAPLKFMAIFMAIAAIVGAMLLL